MDSPVPHVPQGYGSKSVLVRRLLNEANGQRTAADIAAQVGCTTALVSIVAYKSNLKFKRSTRARREGKWIPRELKQSEADAIQHSPLRAPPAIEPLPPPPDKEKLLRLALARQLEEIFARQRRIWGNWL